MDKHPEVVIKLISNLMELWKIVKQRRKDDKKMDKISERPSCRLLQQSRGYRMGSPGSRDISRTHSLFVDDLFVYLFLCVSRKP